MKKIFLVFIIGVLITVSIGCCMLLKQTTSKNSYVRTMDLLDIHFKIAPVIKFDMKKDKIIIFSDLHRGMGQNDVFKNNKELFRCILSHYYNENYTLVLIGDCEEGWGFQRDNIPLILKAHKEEFEIEKNFIEKGRYYRIYGNHDDFFRGQLLYLEELGFHNVYPAIIFKDDCNDCNDFNIFITHSSQGHGLHDAGDELASWAVYTKYAMLMDSFPKNGIKSFNHLGKILRSYNKELDAHEKMVYDWALNGKGEEKKCNILIGGHTHVPVFNSDRDPCLFKLILEDENKVERKDEEKITEQPDIRETEKLALQKKALQKFKKDENVHIHEKVHDPFYFNSGCGFHSKISCIEIKEGKIFLKLLGCDEKGNIDFDSFLKKGELKNYKKTHCGKLDSAIINALSFYYKEGGKVDLISASEESRKGSYAVTVLVTKKTPEQNEKSEVYVYKILKSHKAISKPGKLPEGIRVIDGENICQLIGYQKAYSKLEGKQLPKVTPLVRLSWPCCPNYTEPLYYFDFGDKGCYTVGAYTGKVFD